MRSLFFLSILFSSQSASASYKQTGVDVLTVVNGVIYGIFILIFILLILLYRMKRANDKKMCRAEKVKVEEKPIVKDENSTISEKKMEISLLSDEDVLRMQDVMALETADSKRKLLVVEDNQVIRNYLKILFSSTYQVLLAENGQEGVDVALREVPDVILCDVLMPVKNGFTCCRELKDNLITSHIPIIMLTAKVDTEDVIRGMEAGADDYLLKPVHPEVLKSKIQGLLKNRMKLKQAYMQQLILSDETEQPKELAETENGFVAAVMAIVEANIRESDFNINKLAGMMNMSPSTLYRKIKQSTNFSTIELVRGVRLKKAASLFKQQQYSVQEVAELVGYNDLPSFRKHFTEFFGQTPSAYAKNETSISEP